MNIFQQFKLLFGNLDEFEMIPPNSLFILNMWAGNNKTNLGMALDIEEKKLEGVPDSILLKELYLRINKKLKFIKFPKKQKLEYTYDWLMPYFKTHYNWSNRELDIYWSQIEILISNPDIKLSMARKFGLEDKDRKKLGLDKIPKSKIKKEPKETKGRTKLF